jgi:hypothetical protein
MKYIFYILCFCVAITSNAFGEGMVHKWKSPSFSGIGASAHFLTIENQEFTRKAEIRARKDSAAAKKISAAKNTNYAKFLDNLESRIFAEFSKQLTDNLFGESCGTTYTTATVDGVTTTTQDTPNPQEGNSIDGAGTIVGSNCSGTYSFNDTTVTYTKDVTNDVVTLNIAGPDGSQTITLPLNDFQF